jgi:single-stranded DNA-binding protein
LGVRIAKHVRSGDQLVVEAGVEGRFWTDRAGKQRQDHGFVAMGFRFGAPGPATRALFEAQEDAGHRQEESAACSPAF